MAGNANSGRKPFDPAPRTDEVMRKDYLRHLGIQGNRSRARIDARVTDKDITRWRRDDTVAANGEDFAQTEIRILNGKSRKLRKKVDVILNAVDADGFPRFPNQVMSAARLTLEEFKPPAQQVDHTVSGNIGVAHRHQHVIEAMPDEMLEEFIRTGKSSIEMDRIAEAVWESKK